MSSQLSKMKEILRNRQTTFEGHYYVPRVWNNFGYQTDNNEKVLDVNPYDFYASAIDHITSNPQPLFDDYKCASYYSTMIRTNTTYDHNHDGELDNVNAQGFKETGTFVKMIAYLPTLKEIGINVIYLLPIMSFSKLDRKGELGSVYGVSDFFSLDEGLYDPITNEEMSLDDQFNAFIEACHIYGMRVILDIIPRTNSVNTSLMIPHPEWFYWIDMKDLADYAPPYVEGIADTTKPTIANIQRVYQSEKVQKHLRKFRKAPNLQDPKKWAELVARYESDPTQNPLELVREMFDLTIAPAFSDSINDVQPAWTDVTFFRLYMDHPKIVDELKLSAPENPYILFDTIKGNLFPGTERNEELWQTLSDILPYYIDHFGLDGARTDMGHALPQELTQLIIQKAKAKKPDFYFIAEELNTKEQTAIDAKAMGYDLIIGDGYFHTHRFREERPRDFYYKGMCLPIAVFAAGETHDTPRLISREGGFNTLRFVTIMNQFAFNFVPFMNSGQELLELQPMNTGVDCNENSALILPENDKYYKKLALFDKFQFHYENDYEPFLSTLANVSKIKETYQSLLIDKDAVSYLMTPNKEQIIFRYLGKDECLYILGNASITSASTFDLRLNDYTTLFSTSKDESLTLQPLEIRIVIERI